MAIAVVQARMSSSRLPGKVLKEINNRPMISLQLERLSRSKLVEEIIVATSTDKSDDVLERSLKSEGVTVFRGSLEDVNQRFFELCKTKPIGPTVRITADCPLLDHELVDQVISFFKNGNFQYASNTINRTFPRGLDVEIFDSGSFIDYVSSNTLSNFEKEHVTPIFYNNSELFSIGSFCGDKDLSTHRWTVDTETDFSFVSKIYKSLYFSKPDFTTADILEFLSMNPNFANFETS
jgi:spore coat polysaccharide biosynthesis protein SpsF